MFESAGRPKTFLSFQGSLHFHIFCRFVILGESFDDLYGFFTGYFVYIIVLTGICAMPVIGKDASADIRLAILISL